MANTIIPKRSSIAARVPLATDLQVGELAVNLADALIYTKNAAGTVISINATKLQTGRTIGMTGDVTWTSGAFDGSGNVTGVATLANSGVSAGSYGSSTAVPVITVDAKGRVTSVSTSSISGSLTFTGDVTGTGATGSSTALTLANSGVTAGTYTKVTVDAKGRVTTGTALTSSDVTTALGFTPYNSTNPSGYITTDGTARVRVENNGTLVGTRRAINFIAGSNVTLNIADDAANEEVDVTIGLNLSAAGVSSFNSRSGVVTLTSADVTGALGFTPISTAQVNRGNASGADVNTLTTSGFYRINNTEANRPGDWGQLLVVYGGSDTIGQLYFDYTNGNILSRAGNPSNVGGGGSWSEWRTNLNNANFNSYAPTLTGGGASGTWSISVTGTARGVGTSDPNIGAGGLWVTSASGLNVARNGTAYIVLDAGNYTSYLGDYTFGAYRVIADHGPGANTWYIRSNGRFTWARAHDWSQSFDLDLGSGTTNSNNGWARFGQQTSNSTAGTWFGTRFVQYTGGSTIDGFVRAGRYYLGDDTNYLTQGAGGAVRVQTASGYIDIGSMNSSHAHLQTDRGSFYFNRDVYVDGQLYRYSGSAPYLHSANYNSYAPTLTGGGASGTWGISVTGSANSLNLSGHTISNSSWAGGGGYHGYTYNGGNFRFGFSSTGGVVDVYADGNFYATDSSHLVLHAGNYSSYAAPASHNHNGTNIRVGILTFNGEGGDSGNGSQPTGYGIYQQGGAWSHPYPDLCIAFHTGIKIGAYYGYNGTRFYNNSDWATEIFSVGNGDNHVRVLNDLYVSGNTVSYSDERLKENWRDVQGDFVEQLARVKHGIFDRIDSGVTQVGVSAQSLREVLEPAVVENRDGMLTVNYGNAALLSAVKLAQRVVDQEARIAKLEAALAKLID